MNIIRKKRKVIGNRMEVPCKFRQKKFIAAVVCVTVCVVAFCYVASKQEHLLLRTKCKDRPVLKEKNEVLKHIHITAESDEKITPTSSTIIPNTCASKSRGYFDRIYEEGIWGTRMKKLEDFYTNAEWPPQEARKTSGSGLGSELGSATVNSLKIIRKTIHKYDIKSMVDVPCGDANWIHESFETDTLSLYVGLDVTSKVVDVNNQRFAHHNNKEFHFWDMTECVLPKFHNKTSGTEQPFDLVHVRDVIQHLNLEQGVKYFCNVFRSGAKVLITTTYSAVEVNKNIVEGSWYRNNVEKEPFSFPKSGNCELTHPEIEPDSTCVYDLTEGTWVEEFISNKC